MTKLGYMFHIPVTDRLNTRRPCVQKTIGRSGTVFCHFLLILVLIRVSYCCMYRCTDPEPGCDREVSVCWRRRPSAAAARVLSRSAGLRLRSLRERRPHWILDPVPAGAAGGAARRLPSASTAAARRARGRENQRPRGTREGHRPTIQGSCGHSAADVRLDRGTAFGTAASRRREGAAAAAAFLQAARPIEPALYPRSR
jgi:hypothetical protein